jgi:hypothetical protein
MSLEPPLARGEEGQLGREWVKGQERGSPTHSEGHILLDQEITRALMLANLVLRIATAFCCNHRQMKTSHRELFYMTSEVL